MERAMYTLGTAASAVGIAKSTVLRAIKAGRLSAQRDANGQWAIDPAEFHRVFPPLPSGATAENASTLTDALVAELRATVADLRADRDHWRQEAADWKAQAQRLLPAPVAVNAPPMLTGAPADAPAESEATATAGRLRRAWRWMRATG
jgi:hypothetical protein